MPHCHDCVVTISSKGTKFEHGSSCLVSMPMQALSLVTLINEVISGCHS